MTKLQEIRKKSDKMLNIQKNGIHLQIKDSREKAMPTQGKSKIANLMKTQIQTGG